MARKIYCCECGQYVGEIRNATLKAGLKYICRTCDLPYTQDNSFSNPNKDFADIFQDIFNGKTKL
jgi:hypothetical protein